MHPRRDPVPRARAAGQWLGGILLLGLLAGGMVTAAMLLWENLDVRQLAPALASAPGPLPDPEPPPPPALGPASFSAVLFNSPRNGAYFPDAAFYPAALSRWRGMVEEVGGEVREAASADDLRALAPEDLLVLPEAPCLSRQEVDAIRRHLRAGGSLVSNWAVGARDEACEWRGWEVVAEMTGAGDVRELETREALYLTVPGGMALSPGLDPGTRIELRPEPSLALTLPGQRVYWSDWALNSAPDESGGGADAAATAETLDAGSRSAWFGFRLSQAATPRDSVRMARLVENGIAWAAGVPMASAAPWPDGRAAALLLVEDVEAEYQNASAFAKLLQDLQVPGTFFAVSQLVEGDRALGKALSAAGEVGSQTSDHAPVAGLTLQDQTVRLRRSWSEIEAWAGTAPQGLRPPEEAFDANTLRAWHAAGGRYILAVNQARSAAPELHRVGDGSVILLPRLIKDDYNVFVQEGALRSDRLTGAFLEGIDKLRALGGLAVIGVHTQIVGTGARLEAVRAVADTARAQGGWWMARAGEVADWWRRREGVEVRFVQADDSISEPRSASPSDPSAETRSESPPEPSSESPSEPSSKSPSELSSDSLSMAPTQTSSPHPPMGFDLLVKAPAAESVEDLWVDVVLPGGLGDLQPAVDGAFVAFAATEWGIRVPVGDLPAGTTRRITLRHVSPQE